MNSPKKIAFGFVCSITLIVVGAAFSVSSNMAGPLRSFEFTYLTRIPTLPAGSKISRIWIPLPHSDPYQTVNGLKIESPFPYAKHRDPEYGNEYLSASSGGKAGHCGGGAHKLSCNPPGTPRRARRPPRKRAISWSRPVRSSAVPQTGPPRASRRNHRGALCASESWDPRPARKREQSTTTSSPRCATTSPAPVGGTAMRYGPARPSAATVLISTRCLSV